MLWHQSLPSVAHNKLDKACRNLVEKEFNLEEVLDKISDVLKLHGAGKHVTTAPGQAYSSMVEVACPCCGAHQE